MSVVKIAMNATGKNAFLIYDEQGQEGEMTFDLRGDDIIIYHTEISTQKQGMGYARQLFDVMVDYVRKHNLQVIPLCKYVESLFLKNESKFSDIWNKSQIA